MSYGFGKLNDYVDEAHTVAEINGFTVPAFEETNKLLGKLMLVVTEVAEAAESVREGDLNNYREELADVCIRIFDLAARSESDHDEFGGGPVKWNLEQEIVNKLQKNRERPHMHGKRA